MTGENQSKSKNFKKVCGLKNLTKQQEHVFDFKSWVSDRGFQGILLELLDLFECAWRQCRFCSKASSVLVWQVVDLAPRKLLYSFVFSFFRVYGAPLRRHMRRTGDLNSTFFICQRRRKSIYAVRSFTATVHIAKNEQLCTRTAMHTSQERITQVFFNRFWKY